MNIILRNTFGLTACLLLLTAGFELSAQEIDPNVRYQTLEGWGTSLSWWANIVGEYPDEVIEEICDDLTDSEELNMNIFRYNIHGGDNPASHADTLANHFRWDSGEITSYKHRADAPYDWTANSNQRRILLEILKRKPDAILEAISYSPPYWMTRSKCSAGAIDNGANLPEGNEEMFADFLTDIVKHYHDSLGITFKTITGLNEPSSGYWKAGGIQEGCGVYAEQQAVLIEKIHVQLQKKGMSNYCGISAPEESKVNQTLEALTTASYQGQYDKLAQINTHSYNSVGSKRAEIAAIADANHLKIWQSESGPLNVSINNSFENNLYVAAEQLIPDLKELKAHAWVEWQAASTSEKWGYYTLSKATQSLTKHKNFFVRKQFSKFLRPGYTLIKCSDQYSVAAISPTNDKLVIVHVNQEKQAAKLKYDLAKFSRTAKFAQAFRTSQTENTQPIAPIKIRRNSLQYDAPPTSVTTFVIDISI